MDSLIAAAGRALAAGDALGALKHVALREDAPALALRGIALAQLGDYARSRELLRRATRRFGARELMARARCVVAEAEVSLALRDFGAAPRALAEAAALLQAHGDLLNACQARLIAVRRLLLLGRLQMAQAALDEVTVAALPPTLAAIAALAAAELALRSLRTADAQSALDQAAAAAKLAGVPALQAEVEELRSLLTRDAARVIRAGHEQLLRLSDVETLLHSDALVVDACRRHLRAGEFHVPLARRPLLFALLRALALSWPADAERALLIRQVFRTQHADDTLRARLRVETGRLRTLVAPVATIDATAQGFALRPRDDRRVAVLAPPVEGEQGSLLALLGDGASWSTSALALALGDSQRTVQRALVALQASGQVRAVGRARAQRWLAPPLAGFTAILLLPSLASPR